MPGPEPLDQLGQKRVAAQRACQEIVDGMLVGLGTGSTAEIAVRCLAQRVQTGLRITGVATSEATARLARGLGIPLTTLDQEWDLDIDIDGADEVDPRGNLVKGLGGALLREKIVARAAKRLIIAVDEGKQVTRLGERAPIPVEVVRFGWRRTAEALRQLGGEPALRGGEMNPFVTDGGNLLLDCRFAGPWEPSILAARCKGLVGVVEHGLFVDMRPTVVVGQADGRVTMR